MDTNIKRLEPAPEPVPPGRRAALFLERAESRLTIHARREKECDQFPFENCPRCGGDELRKELAKLYEVIGRALMRYENPDEKHNKGGGFPRGEIAWAMARDLQEAGL